MVSPWQVVLHTLTPPATMTTYVAVAALLLLALLLLRMRSRRYYFVRHGETILNAQRIRQGADGGLSEKGKTQADATGRFLSQFQIHRIVSSTFERARETATIINTHLHVPIVYSPLVAERRNPSQIIGRSSDNPEVAKVVDMMDMSYHDDAYRFSDEENFQDLKKRARKALALLARQGVRETCVVTHSIFLQMLIAYLLYRENLHAADYAKVSFFNPSDNAGVTICDYHPWRAFSKTRGWEVIAYNERIAA